MSHTLLKTVCLNQDVTKACLLPLVDFFLNLFWARDRFLLNSLFLSFAIICWRNQVWILLTAFPWYYITHSFIFPVSLLWDTEIWLDLDLFFISGGKLTLYVSISRHIMTQHLINTPPEIKSECIQISTPHNKFIENTKDISVFDTSSHWWPSPGSTGFEIWGHPNATTPSFIYWAAAIKRSYPL